MRAAASHPSTGARALRVLLIAAAGVGGATAACSSILGFESEYDVVAPDAGPDGPAQGGGSAQAGAGGEASTGGAGGGGGAACAHSPCKGGMPLEDGCDSCVTEVCAQDAVCCSMAWDIVCVKAAQALCDLPCCGDGLCLGLGNSCGECAADCGGCNCPHSVCEEGAALSEAGCRQACIAPVCGQLFTCCGNYGWTIDCYQLAADACPLDPCVAAVCDQMPSCCNTAWTATCVNIAKNECAATTCDCAHPLCQSGAKLVDGCDPCVSAICEADPFCCGSTWDDYCVAEVQTVCDIACP